MTEFLKRISSKADVRNTMAILWMVLSFRLIDKFMTIKVPPDNLELMKSIVMLVVGQLTIICGYYYITSKSEVDAKKADSTP
jgi:hypothetical protein